MRRSIPTLGLTVNYVCEKCKAELEARELDEERARVVDLLLSKSGATSRLSELSLETYPADAARSAARRVGEQWLTDFAGGARANLLLFGDVGRGKTGLAWSIGRKLIVEHQVAVKFVNVRDLLNEIRDAIRTNQPFTIEDLVEVDVLVLDDLGGERPTEFGLDLTATLLEKRYGARRPLIVTSNYDPTELAGRLGRDDLAIGKRIVSRLIEGAVQHRIGGSDLRLR